MSFIKRKNIAAANNPTIIQKLSSLFNVVVNNLEGDLKELVRSNCFIAGGCFVSLVKIEKVNDYDFYFTSKDAVDKFVTYIDTASRNATLFSNQNKLKYTFKLTHTSDQALSFELYPDFGEPVKIQFITKYFGQPEDVVSKFDFFHCCSFYYPEKERIKVLYAEIQSGYLKYNLNSPYPISALKRMQKFINRGWKIRDGELIKICLAINSLEIHSNKDVQDQIKGMYSDEKLDVPRILKDLKNKSFGKKLETLIED